MKTGIPYGIGAFLIWGLFPAYWKLLAEISPYELIAHRIVWSFVFLFIIFTLTIQWRSLFTKLNYSVLRKYVISSLLISSNWLIFIWAIANGAIVESSLGYFIGPLVTISLGVCVMKEKLRITQTIPILIAFIGIVYLTYVYGSIPFISLSLAITFGLYTLLKKKSTLGSLHGLIMETGVIFIPATLFLIYKDLSGVGSFMNVSYKIDLLIILSGAVTILPLVLFSIAAQKTPMSIMGVMQYITPTIHFILGVFVYKESFDIDHLIGFCFVWVAIIVFWIEYSYKNIKSYKDKKTKAMDY